MIASKETLHERFQILNRNHLRLPYTRLFIHLTHRTDIIRLLGISATLWKSPLWSCRSLWATRNQLINCPELPRRICNTGVNQLPFRLGNLILILIQMRMIETPHAIPQFLKRSCTILLPLCIRYSTKMKTNIFNISNLVTTTH